MLEQSPLPPPTTTITTTTTTTKTPSCSRPKSPRLCDVHVLEDGAGAVRRAGLHLRGPAHGRHRRRPHPQQHALPARWVWVARRGGRRCVGRGGQHGMGRHLVGTRDCVGWDVAPGPGRGAPSPSLGRERIRPAPRRRALARLQAKRWMPRRTTGSWSICWQTPWCST